MIEISDHDEEEKGLEARVIITWKDQENKWKQATLKGLVNAFTVCSEQQLLDKELEHLKTTFKEINGFPNKVIKKTIKQVQNQQTTRDPLQLPDNTETQKTLYISLPFVGQIGTNLIKRLKYMVPKYVSENVNINCVYNAKKLGSKFPTKDKPRLQHKHNVIYKATCPDDQCSATYIGETARRIEERIQDHGTRDKKSTIYKHSETTHHEHVNESNFQILAEHYAWEQKRKIAEAVLIKEHNPDLNEQGQSVPLKLLN